MTDEITADELEILDDTELAEVAKKHKLDLNKLKGIYERFKVKALDMMQDDGEMERFLVKLEAKLADVPVLGGELKHIPVLVSLLRSYIIKEYTLPPTGTVAAIIAALLYWVSPLDLFPDGIPGVGVIDDIVVVALCWKLVETDVELYEDWRKQQAALPSAAPAANLPETVE